MQEAVGANPRGIFIIWAAYYTRAEVGAGDNINGGSRKLSLFLRRSNSTILAMKRKPI